MRERGLHGRPRRQLFWGYIRYDPTGMPLLPARYQLIRIQYTQYVNFLILEFLIIRIRIDDRKRGAYIFRFAFFPIVRTINQRARSLGKFKGYSRN